MLPSGGGTFLIGLAAARGYVRKTNNMKALDGALDKLVAELQSGKDDPCAFRRMTTRWG